MPNKTIPKKTITMTNNRFDRKAADWDKKEMRRKLADAVAKAIDALDLKNVELALDFGCGTGLVSIPLASRIKRIIALDSSAGMIEVLQGKIDDLHLVNMEAVQAQITATDLPADFDLIFTSMTLHHIADPVEVLERFGQLLKTGGRVAIADLDAEDGSFHNPGAEEKHHGFQRDSLRRELEKSGFQDIDFATVYTIGKTMTDGTVKDFTVFLATAVKGNSS